jgi:hypothetical protein
MALKVSIFMRVMLEKSSLLYDKRQVYFCEDHSCINSQQMKGKAAERCMSDVHYSGCY